MKKIINIMIKWNERNLADKGITLIALVITIIVLLILASVSIAMLTGTNGILTQAQNAKQANEISSKEEKLKLAVTGAIADSENMNFEKLKAELSNYNITTQSSKFPAIVDINGKKLAINSIGSIIEYKNMSEITGEETSNTVTKDWLENYIVVPAGFKILNAVDNVTQGIVIEDVSHKQTKGSQFVWIPVGNVTKEDRTVQSIKLSRYTFDDKGKEIEQGNSMIGGCYKEINNSKNENWTAKENIETEQEGFRKSAIANNGYYIARYEAKDKNATEPRSSGSVTSNLTVSNAENYVYSNVTQPQAAKLSREMYSDNNFESDLTNSFSWDTALLFLERFGSNSNYANQKSLNSEPEYKGTTVDVECNIYDMASNYREWSTESTEKEQYVLRGGGYLSKEYYTNIRNYVGHNTYGDVAFRVILYIK